MHRALVVCGVTLAVACRGADESNAPPASAASGGPGVGTVAAGGVDAGGAAAGVTGGIAAGSDGGSSGWGAAGATTAAAADAAPAQAADTPSADAAALDDAGPVFGSGDARIESGPVVPADVLPVSEWVRRFDSVEGEAAEVLLRNSQSSDSWLIYESGYYWEGYVSMYEATGDTRFLDAVWVSIDNWMDRALSCDQVPGSTNEPQFRGWSSKTHPQGANGYEVPLFESYGWRFVTRLLYLMRAQPGYEAQFQKLLAFTEVDIWDKWHARGVAENMYRVNTHMASHWAYIASFLAQVTQSPTRRAQCLTVADDISHAGMPNRGGHSLRSQVIDSPVLAGASFWDTEWGSTERPGSDVNHGEAVVSFAVEAHQLGFTAWSAADMSKLATLLGGVIWPSAGAGARYVDGSGTGNGWLHGYAKLGRFDVALHQRLEAHATGNDSVWHIGNMAASARRLRGRLD